MDQSDFMTQIKIRKTVKCIQLLWTKVRLRCKNELEKKIKNERSQKFKSKWSCIFKNWSILTKSEPINANIFRPISNQENNQFLQHHRIDLQQFLLLLSFPSLSISHSRNKFVVKMTNLRLVISLVINYPKTLRRGGFG